MSTERQSIVVVIQIHVSALAPSAMTVENVQLRINIFPAMTQLGGAGGGGVEGL